VVYYTGFQVEFTAGLPITGGFIDNLTQKGIVAGMTGPETDVNAIGGGSSYGEELAAITYCCKLFSHLNNSLALILFSLTISARS
jgi:hypothetical protein